MKVKTYKNKQLKGMYNANLENDNGDIIFWEIATSKTAAIKKLLVCVGKFYELERKKTLAQSAKFNELRSVLDK